jgi:hypothetical protein
MRTFVLTESAPRPLGPFASASIMRAMVFCIDTFGKSYRHSAIEFSDTTDSFVLTENIVGREVAINARLNSVEAPNTETV